MPDRRRLVLEVEPGTDPPVGSLRDEDGRSIEFTGWLGLASALDRTLSRGRRGDGQESSGAPPDTTDAR